MSLTLVVSEYHTGWFSGIESQEARKGLVSLSALGPNGLESKRNLQTKGHKWGRGDFRRVTQNILGGKRFLF